MATKNIGFVAELIGDAQVRSVDGVIRVLSIGDQIHEGDILTTGLGTEIVLEFYGGHKLQVGENTEVLLDESVFSGLKDFPDERVDQLAELQSLIVEGVDLADLEPTAAGTAESAAALHQASVYTRDGAEGIVETRVTPFNVGAGIDDQSTLTNVTVTRPDPIASITVNNITADDIINAAEANGMMNVTGTVSGVVAMGGSVNLYVNGTAYSGTVAANNTFSIMVAAADLVANTSFNATVSGTDVDANPYSATTVSTHIVDTAATATITLDANITADDSIDTAEVLTTVAITGAVAGDFQAGDIVTLTANGVSTTGSVLADGSFSIDVNGSDLRNDPDGTIDASFVATDAAGNVAAPVTDTETYTVNNPPNAMDDAGALDIAEDGTTVSLNATMLANDNDLDGDAINITAINSTALIGGVQSIAVANGTVNVDAGNNITFTPNANYNGAVSFDYTLSDGSLTDTSTVSGTISAINDAATVTVTATDTAAIEDDLANQTANGTVSVVDPDTGESTLSGAPTATYGSVTESGGNWTYTLNNANATIQALADGELLVDTITFTSADGTSISTQNITITGSNDAATITVTPLDTAVTEDDGADQTANGTIAISDIDNGEGTLASSVATYGSVTESGGNWTYTLNNANATVQALADGETLVDTITFTSDDGTTATQAITITGANDAATITVTPLDTAVAEDDLGNQSAAGTIAISDTDNGEGSLVSSTATYGSVTENGGNWTYTLNNANATIQALADGETLVDTITFTSDDGTTATQNITITGTNDAATVSSDSQTLNETNSPVSTSGTLTSTDIDNPDDTFTPVTTVGTIGTFSINAAGAWTFTANSAFDYLNDGENVNETFNVTSVDGTPSTVQITIDGTNDSEPDIGVVYESALGNGTGIGGGSSTVTGNIFANDPGANAFSALDDVNGTTPTAGVITINTAIGTLTVYADDSTPGFSAGDYEYVLNTPDGSSNDIDEVFTYTFTEGTVTFSDTLTITVVDDVPVANNLVQDIPESNEPVFNVALTLDISTSMRAQVGGTGQTRFELAKEALDALGQEYFNQSTQVQLTVILFADGAHNFGTFDNYSDFATSLASVQDAGSSNYSNDLLPANGGPGDPGGDTNTTVRDGTSYVDPTALIEHIISQDIAAQTPGDDVQNISYFLSDGAITRDTNVDLFANGFGTFVNDNSVNSYSIGIGTGLPGDLSDLNYIHNIDSYGRGGGHVDDALIVSDVSQLESALLSLVPTAIGGNITANGSVSNILFGADGGHVESITTDIGGTDYTFSFDGATVTMSPALPTVVIDGTIVQIGTDDGFTYGTFTFDFADGTYTLAAPKSTAPAVFDFDFSIIDGDGDTASATATINIIDGAPEASDDLHSLVANEVAEGNVITGIGTDGGPSSGANSTPFALPGSGVDKIVDDAVVTEITYKGSVIDLNLTTSLGAPPTGVPESVSVLSQGAIDGSQFKVTGSAGFTFDADGIGVAGGSNANLNTGELLTVDFLGKGLLDYGVDNLILTISDYQSAYSDTVTITVYDTVGATLGTIVQTATNNSNETVDLSAFSGVGSIDIAETGGGTDIQVLNISYDPAPATEVLDQTGGNNGSNLSWVYGYETDLDGDAVYQATITDSIGGYELIVSSNGYYKFTPPPIVTGNSEDIFVDNQGAIDASNFTVTGFDKDGIPESPGFEAGKGMGVDDEKLNKGESLLIDFNLTALPYGVVNLILTMDSMGGGDDVYVTVYDLDGTTVLASFNHDGGDGADIDLSAYTGIGSVNIEHTSGGHTKLQSVDYDPVPAPVVFTPLDEPVIIDYVLTDTDGQSDTAQLSLYTMDQTLTGTGGADTIAGGSLNDAIIGDAGDDILSGNAGHDLLSGGDGDDVLDGGAGNDNLSGGDGIDTLTGGTGQDHLEGGAGDDRLNGGSGDDILIGGAGIDIFALDSGDEGTVGTPAVDTIADFTLGVGGDVLDLSDMLQGEETDPLDGFMNFSYNGVSGDTTISIDVDASSGTAQQIVLSGVDLTANGTLTDSQILDNLLNNGNLIVDQ